MEQGPKPWTHEQHAALKTYAIFTSPNPIDGLRSTIAHGIVREEDAKLMAKAPELLASLEELSEWMRANIRYMPTVNEMLIKAVENIKAAGGTVR